jgi:hypothetical protein
VKVCCLIHLGDGPNVDSQNDSKTKADAVYVGGQFDVQHAEHTVLNCIYVSCCALVIDTISVHLSRTDGDKTDTLWPAQALCLRPTRVVGWLDPQPV